MMRGLRAWCPGSLIALPLLAPIIELICTPEAWLVWNEASRVSVLFWHSSLLAILTTIIALPIGVVFALLIERSSWWGRIACQYAIAGMLFVPLPLYLSAWQAAIGSTGVRPWMEGVIPAAIIHASAAFPWVVLILRIGIRSLSPVLEESARLVLPGMQVILRVTIRQLFWPIVLASLWVIVQTLTEIVITDMLLVRTFAEEVYTQFVTGTIGASSALALQWPVYATGLVILLVSQRSRSRWSAFHVRSTTPMKLFGIPGWFGMVITVFVIGLWAMPMVGMLVRIEAGQGWERAGRLFANALIGQGTLVVQSLIEAILAGLLALIMAGWLLTITRGNSQGRMIVFGLAWFAWLTPGPLLGIGLKSLIDYLMRLESLILPAGGPISWSLYEIANPTPVIWVHLVRLFPYAVVLWYLIFRSIHPAMNERTRMIGIDSMAYLRWVVFPTSRRMLLPMVLLLALLVLGEISASKMVVIPGYTTFAQELFSQMHYGVGPTVASLGLVQLLMTYGFAMVLFHHTGEEMIGSRRESV